MDVCDWESLCSYEGIILQEPPPPTREFWDSLRDLLFLSGAPELRAMFLCANVSNESRQSI